MPSFFKNITFTFSSRFLAAIFTSLSTILISRAFGPVGKGIFTMVAFFPALALSFGHLGLGNANTYLISQDKEKSKKFFYNSFWYGLIIGWLFIIVFTLIYRFSPTSLVGKGQIGSWAFYLSLFAIPFVLWENFYQGIFVGRQEFKFFNLIILFSKILLFIGLVFLIYFYNINLSNIKIAIIYYVLLMSLPAIIYSLYFVFQYGFPFEFDKEILRKTISFGIRSYLACLLAFLVLRSDIYFLNYFRGLEEVGWYSLAVGFCDGILLLISSITLVLFPKITENQEQGLETTLKVSRITSLALFVIIIFSYLFGKPIILLLFGEQFLNSILPLYILLPAIYFLAITSFLTQFFASKGFPWITVWLWFPGLIINILLNMLYIPKYGMVVAALTSLIAYFLSFILHYIYLQRYAKVSFSKILVPKLNEVLNLLKSPFKDESLFK